MKRTVSLCAAVVLLFSVFSGCKKMPTVDESVQPELHFSLYKQLTDLYGTPWRDALEQLGIDQQELTIGGLEHLGVPLTENYANVGFDTYLRFSGEDNYLCGVEYSATYQYPEDEEKLLRDIVAISSELIADFGEASDTSYVFNWAELFLDEEWDRDIRYWQDISVLKRIVDEGFGSTLLYWDMTPVASESVKACLQKYAASGGRHGLSLSVSDTDSEGTVTLRISY